MNYIIGAGGIGSRLAGEIVRMTSPKEVTIIDRDLLEKKNLDRQLFDERDLGECKAVALGRRLGTASRPDWFTMALTSMSPQDCLLCCVDNHPGRHEVLKTCDLYGCTAIIGGNETLSSEAFYYQRDWRGTDHDPRSYYPEITTSNANDPRAIAIGCIEAAKSNRQLGSANNMAAALMQHLYVVWQMEARKVDKEARKFLPHRLAVTMTKLVATCAAEQPRKET